MMDIAKHAEKILWIKWFADKFYNYLWKGYYSLSTPVRTNFWNWRGMPISCHSIEMWDSVADIMHTNWELWVMTKLGAWVWTYFWNLRPRWTAITNNWESSGSVHFMEMFDKTASVISQGNSRRWATTPYLPVEHWDIEEFLEIGTEWHPIQRCTTAVTISNEWMKEMLEWDKDKRKIRAKILKRRSEVGYPYITFVWNANEQRVDVYKDKWLDVKTSNICVVWDTKILTDRWYLEISSLEDEEINVWNWFEFTKTIVRKTWENQEIINVKTNSWYEINCTPYHKFYIQNWYWNYSENMSLKRAFELEPWDKIIKHNLPIIDWDKNLDYAYDNWFYSWDWCVYQKRQRIYLYWEKKKLKDRFLSITKRNNQEDQDRMYWHTNLLMDKFFVPNSEYTIESRIEWLSWLFDADWYVTTNNTWAQTIQLVSINKQFLFDLQLMLQTLWCDSKIRKQSDWWIRKMPKNDWSGEMWDYLTKEARRILINWNSLYKLISLWLDCWRLKRTWKEPSRLCSEFVKIESVEYLTNKEDVYCFTEEKRWMWMFNWILTWNCQEIFLNTDEKHSFVCCLSSINLLHRDEIKDTDAVETMVCFLDAVMQEFINKLESLRDSDKKEDKITFHFMEKAYNFALRERAIWVWVLGWHSYLQSKMIAIESEEASAINIDIWKIIKDKTYSASMWMADTYWEPSLLKWYWRRHSHLMAVAPTTSSAFILWQVSQSIEPLMSNYYTKNLAKHTATIRNIYLEKLLKEKRMNNRDVWDSIRDYDGSVQHLDFLTLEEKQVFKTFKEIDQEILLQQASDRQKYIDQWQSLNTMITPSMTAKDVSNLCIKAWELGLKWLYYAHSINAAQETVRSIKQASDIEKVCYIWCKSCEA